MSDLAPEDGKLVTLARSTRLRARAAEGAAVRDADGRTYAAATVALDSLRLSAVEACVAMVLASGARELEAAVVLTDADEVSARDLAVLAELSGGGVPVHRVDARGALQASSTT